MHFESLEAILQIQTRSLEIVLRKQEPSQIQKVIQSQMVEIGSSQKVNFQKQVAAVKERHFERRIMEVVVSLKQKWEVD